MAGNPVALVTGASSGLGLEIARVLAQEGFDLVLVARSEGRLYAVKDELELGSSVACHVCACDLSVYDAALDVHDFCLERGLEVSVLVNSAGFGDSGAFHRAGWARQADMVQVNVTALMQLTRLFVPGMVGRGAGMVMNLSSVAAFSAGPYMSVYYATKAFVLSFSEALHDELAPHGVAVMALCPGPTATGFEKAAAMGSGSTMFRHAASAADVARAGVAALRQGRAACYHGAFTKLASFGARIAPRAVVRRFASMMNGASR